MTSWRPWESLNIVLSNIGVVKTGYSTWYSAEPINGMWITPWPEDGDDHCLHCAREVRVSPMLDGQSYWFHIGTFLKECKESELIRLDELERLP